MKCALLKMARVKRQENYIYKWVKLTIWRKYRWILLYKDQKGKQSWEFLSSEVIKLSKHRLFSFFRVWTLAWKLIQHAIFWRIVVLICLTQLVKEFSYLQLNLFATILQICFIFFTYNVFKIAFVLFCYVSESVRLLLASTTSELRLYIKCVSDC